MFRGAAELVTEATRSAASGREIEAKSRSREGLLPCSWGQAAHSVPTSQGPSRKLVNIPEASNQKQQEHAHLGEADEEDQ